MARKSRITQKNSPPISEVVAAPAVPAPKALVFISHDTRDADLAEAFADLIADVSAGTVKSFRSSDNKGTSGIEFGENWYAAILAKLGEATDVVALLTTSSIDRPWILYEAGIAAGKLNTRVMGVTLGVPLTRATAGPFGQFQNSTDEEEPITKLMMQLLRRNPDAAPREEAVRTQVKTFRGKVKKLLEDRGSDDEEVAESSEQSIAKMFEEVKEMVRELPERFEMRPGLTSRRLRIPHRRARDISIAMEEFLQGRLLGDIDESGTIGLMMLLSMYREDFPWLYEIGLDFQRTIQSGNKSEIKRQLGQMHNVIEFTAHGPMREMSPEDMEARHLLTRLHDAIERIADHAVSKKAPTTRLRELK